LIHCIKIIQKKITIVIHPPAEDGIMKVNGKLQATSYKLQAASYKPQAASNKPQASSNKRLDKVK
jgi:hypothetical protein